jgi:putative ABC transport system substrate-binding protein
MMHGHEKSRSAIVAVKPTNKAERSAAESVERRAETKGNVDQQRTRRTQRRISVSQMLARIRQHIVAVDTQGGNRMRESCTYGSVRGVRGNSHPYRDRFLLQCICLLLAHSVEPLRCEGSDAIGAKRTCRGRRERVDVTKMTHKRHCPPNFAVMHNTAAIRDVVACPPWLEGESMRRREFITVLGGAAAAACTWPFAALAQAPAKRPRITFLGGSEPRPSAKLADAFIEGMRVLNYTEGRDFEMEYRWAQGYLERLPALAEELVRRGADMIVVGNVQSAVALRDATETIPIVSAMLDDPVGLGLIKSDAKPSGNVTGLLASLPGLPTKQLELVRDWVPGATRIGLLVNPTNVSDLSQRQEMETAGAAMGVTLIPVETRAPEDLDPVFHALARERVDFVIVLRDPLFFTRRRTIAAAALATRLPTIYAFREPVDDGGLISYGINMSQNFRRAADYVVKILKGAKPGDLPVEFPTKLELVINLPTAKALGLQVPPSLLARADEVIE